MQSVVVAKGSQNDGDHVLFDETPVTVKEVSADVKVVSGGTSIDHAARHTRRELPPGEKTLTIARQYTPNGGWTNVED